MREGATFGLARRLQNGDLPLGEAFSFISGLYFRGKLAYATAFSSAPDGLPGALIITACGGLLPPETPINQEQLCLISSAPVDASEPRYRIPLERDARLVAAHLTGDCEIVLLVALLRRSMWNAACHFWRPAGISQRICRAGRHEPRRTDAPLRA